MEKYHLRVLIATMETVINLSDHTTLTDSLIVNGISKTLHRRTLSPTLYRGTSPRKVFMRAIEIGSYINLPVPKKTPICFGICSTRINDPDPKKPRQ